MAEPVSMYCLAGFLYSCYSAYKVAKKVTSWNEAHMQLNQAIKGRDALAATTGEAGVAPYRADGLYDQRRKPFPGSFPLACHCPPLSSAHDNRHSSRTHFHSVVLQP